MVDGEGGAERKGKVSKGKITISFPSVVINPSGPSSPPPPPLFLLLLPLLCRVRGDPNTCSVPTFQAHPHPPLRCDIVFQNEVFPVGLLSGFLSSARVYLQKLDLHYGCFLAIVNRRVNLETCSIMQRNLWYFIHLTCVPTLHEPLLLWASGNYTRIIMASLQSAINITLLSIVRCLDIKKKIV